MTFQSQFLHLAFERVAQLTLTVQNPVIDLRVALGDDCIRTRTDIGARHQGDWLVKAGPDDVPLALALPRDTQDVSTVLRICHAAGIPVHVWVDETRPRNQGARLTAWELGQHGVAHTLIADNAGGHLMQHGQVDLVITGTDRTSASGDVANKIGTYLKALAAHDRFTAVGRLARSTSAERCTCPARSPPAATASSAARAIP